MKFEQIDELNVSLAESSKKNLNLVTINLDLKKHRIKLNKELKNLKDDKINYQNEIKKLQNENKLFKEKIKQQNDKNQKLQEKYHLYSLK